MYMYLNKRHIIHSLWMPFFKLLYIWEIKVYGGIITLDIVNGINVWYNHSDILTILQVMGTMKTDIYIVISNINQLNRHAGFAGVKQNIEPRRIITGGGGIIQRRIMTRGRITHTCCTLFCFFLVKISSIHKLFCDGL